MPFTHTVRVRYAEVDAQRVVFNAHWLTYFDDTMTRYLEHLGYDAQETWMDPGEWDVMLRTATLTWEGPARFDDEVAIEIVPSRLGTSSFDLTFTARVRGEVVVVGTTTYVTVVPNQARSQPIPDHLRAALTRDLRT